jgi:hypothetical protein
VSHVTCHFALESQVTSCSSHVTTHSPRLSSSSYLDDLGLTAHGSRPNERLQHRVDSMLDDVDQNDSIARLNVTHVWFSSASSLLPQAVKRCWPHVVHLAPPSANAISQPPLPPQQSDAWPQPPCPWTCLCLHWTCQTNVNQHLKD